MATDVLLALLLIAATPTSPPYAEKRDVKEDRCMPLEDPMDHEFYIDAPL